MSSQYEFDIWGTPQGYQEKIASDILIGTWLTKGSQNVLIAKDGTVQSVKGRKLLGDRRNTNYGIAWGDTWYPSSGEERAMRSRYDQLQVLYKGSWITIAKGFGSKVSFQWDSYWSIQQKNDYALFVNGTEYVHAWLGGVTEVASVTANTITKKFVMRGGIGADTLTFGSVNTLTSTRWSILGFKVGDTIVIVGATNPANNQTSIITDLTGNVATLNNPTVSEVNVLNTCNVYVLGKAFWQQERFANVLGSTEEKKLVIGNTTYSYTGGADSEVLTGVTPDPLAGGVVANDIAVSVFISNKPSTVYPQINTTGMPAGTIIDSVRVNGQQAYYGSGSYFEGYMSNVASKTTSNKYLDCNYTLSGRVAGEGMTFNFDSNFVGYVVSDEGQMHVTCGKSDMYEIKFVSQTVGTVATEQVVVNKIKTSYGQGAVGQNALTKDSNGIVYLSNDDNINYLSRVGVPITQTNLPLSDAIRPLIQRLNKKRVFAKNWQSFNWFLFPDDSVLLCYDIEQKLWNPPLIFRGSALSIVEGRLVIHSSVNENSYTLFASDTDDGKVMKHDAVYSYKNGGKRTQQLYADQMYFESRINKQVKALQVHKQLGINGSVYNDTEQISYADGTPFVENIESTGGIGQYIIGYQPVGVLYANEDTDSVVGDLFKYRRILPVPLNGAEFFECRFAVSMEDLGGHFQIISGGINYRPSETIMAEYVKAS